MRVVAAGAVLGRDKVWLCGAAARVVVHAAAGKPGARCRIKETRAEFFFAAKAKRPPAARADAKGARFADAAHDVVARGVLEARLRTPGARAHGVCLRARRRASVRADAGTPPRVGLRDGRRRKCGSLALPLALPLAVALAVALDAVQNNGSASSGRRSGGLRGMGGARAKPRPRRMRRQRV